MSDSLDDLDNVGLIKNTFCKHGLWPHECIKCTPARKDKATCNKCENESWVIYTNKIKCSICGEEYHPTDDELIWDIVHNVNTQ